MKETGYTGADFSAMQGFGRSLSQLPEVLAVLDKHAIQLYAVYINIWIDEPGCPADLREAIRQLAGRPTVIWAALRSREYPPGAVAGESTAIRRVRSVADVAAGSGIRVALYPHTAFYAETLDANLRIAAKVGRDNVGVTFNLCHWLRVEQGRDFDGIIARALPYLMLVTINGADQPNKR